MPSTDPVSLITNFRLIVSYTDPDLEFVKKFTIVNFFSLDTYSDPMWVLDDTGSVEGI